MLHVKVLQGTQLPAVDTGGTMDPYVKIYVLPTAQTDTTRYLKKVKTKVIKKTLTPQWNEVFSFDMKSFAPNYVLRFELWDWNRVQSRGVSYAIVPLERVADGSPFAVVLTMKPLKKKVEKGGVIQVLFHKCEKGVLPFETSTKTTGTLPQVPAPEKTGEQGQATTSPSIAPEAIAGPGVPVISPEQATGYLKMPAVLIEKAKKKPKKHKQEKGDVIGNVNDLGKDILGRIDGTKTAERRLEKKDPHPAPPYIGNGDSSDEAIEFDEEYSEESAPVARPLAASVWQLGMGDLPHVSKYPIHLIPFGTDLIHNEDDGLIIAGELERRLRTRRFRVDNQSLRSAIKDINEIINKCEQESVLMLIMSNSAISKMRIVATAYNEMNFVITDLDGCQFDPQTPIFSDMTVGAEIRNKIDITRLLLENPSFELGCDVDRFLANYAYAKALKHNSSGCLLIETPGFDSIPLQSQVASLICLVEYLVHVVS